MGALLKEALKMLCGANQWCYAVFWKIGCQNPKLLIWEESYCEPAPGSVPSCNSGIENPDLPFGEWEGCLGSEISSSELGNQAWDRVHLLVNKMMMNTRIHIVGQGIVGRAAFTGSHQWLLANNFIRDALPLEVLNEVHLQFSSGMQTVAVIPILPHGVVQLGSSLTIMENMAFVNDVKSLVLQLGCIPGALLSDNYGMEECAEKIGIPVSLATTVSMDVSGAFRATKSISSMDERCNQQSNLRQASRLVGQPSPIAREVQTNQQVTTSTSQSPSFTGVLAKSLDGHCEPKASQEIKSNVNFRSQLNGGVVGAEVIPSSSALWVNRQVSLNSPRPGFNYQPIIGQSTSICSSVRSMQPQILAVVQDYIANNVKEPKPEKSADVHSSCTQLARLGLQNVDSSKSEVPLSIPVNQLITSHMLSGLSEQGHYSADSRNTEVGLDPKKEKMDSDLFQALNIPATRANDHMQLDEQLPVTFHDCINHESGSFVPGPTNVKYENSSIQSSSGDDLIDVLGVDLKNKLLKGKWNNVLGNGLNSETQNMAKDTSTLMNMQDVFSGIFANEGTSNKSIYSGVATDHLLDAVVTRTQSTGKQIPDDDVSCKTTLTKITSSSIPSSSPSYGQVTMPNQVQREILGLPKSLTKTGSLASSSYQSGCSRDDAVTCSQTTSIYGSQISSWVEQGHNVKREASVSTAYSKRNDEITKPNRKRLKPGENPRPRPKDRQMIQDRVKELREIVPNGAKCSIDALLEKTIKHMLFLQSVTKHADKLKQTGDSKIINKEGGLLLKDNFEGGATWAFEVGSQSMVCPIVVEDLNPPRQMLVEMLCEERGFFLEIADLIRGLGLTILKGVMETRNDKIWARFAVEANRDVTRMEIFMSLVHLLEQTVKGSTHSANAPDGNNMIAHHTFPQAASIAATGSR